MSSFQPTHFLVQLLLPLRDNDGQSFTPNIWEGVQNVLVERFGGVTAYTRSPAEGIWAPRAGEKLCEDVFIVEVIVKDLDRKWWKALQEELEGILRQEKLIIRAVPIINLD